ncbi:putative UDP-glycosyltransferase 74F2-like [Capsicum annuum]|nr:putative UDP-glycosyltransferase 74F2-like [Capsicum annuum]
MLLYMLIVYKFTEIGMHLVPKLSNCTDNGRLEIWPHRDWELESIHSIKVLEMVKEMGWEDKLNVKDKRPLTQFKEAKSVFEKHNSALFGDESNEEVSTSFTSLRRVVLEAVAFGSFLWDAEDCVRELYITSKF